MLKLKVLPAALSCAAWVLCLSPAVTAGEPELPSAGSVDIEVTATRTPEDTLEVPASITVIGGDELAARGSTDLASALSLTAGVNIAPGGDGGPASAVPELWGLREFDAFLLVVDGVPWGGAFVPALNAVDLHNVERIEILRGSAPVMYGATSFVGVIHVIHRAAGAKGSAGRLFAGRFGSFGAAYSMPLPAAGAWQHSLNVDGEKQSFADDRTEFRRGHALYRGAIDTGGGRLHLDADVQVLRQDPASPAVRDGVKLSRLVPLDANNNPSDARLDDDRFHVALGFDRPLGDAEWSTTLAVTRTNRQVLRGFLAVLEEVDPNALGYSQDAHLTDLYFDSHLSAPLGPRLHLVAGVDHLYGKGEQSSDNFDYPVALDGSDPPAGGDQPVGEKTFLEDERNFSGLYAQVEWKPIDAVHVEVGARLNHTRETIDGKAENFEEKGPVVDKSSDSRTSTRGSGIVGISGRVWHRDADAVWVYGDYRTTFKPAVVDFGPEAEGAILAPETAESYESGVKGRMLGGRLDWELSLFRMDFRNLVVPQQKNGLPALVNAGEERFQGGEVEASYRITDALRAQASFARHSSRFTDFEQLFGDTLQQLAGNRLEMSPRTLAATALTWAPKTGLNAFVGWNYTGERFLNKRNTAPVGSFALWSAGIGYRFGASEIRLDGRNLGDRRDPVTESELGDAQYYRQPARSWTVSWSARY